MATKYERLQALTVKKEVKQGVFVYAPLATYLKAGIVKPFSDHFAFSDEGKILNINESILTSLSEVIAKVGDILDANGDLIVSKAVGDQFGNPIHTTYATEVDLQENVAKIVDGRTIAKHAEIADKDSRGKKFTQYYGDKLGGGGLFTADSRTYYVRLYAPDHTDITSNDPKLSLVTITIPKATTGRDEGVGAMAGLLSSSDKIKIDDLPTNAKLTDAYLGYFVARAKADKDGNQIDINYVKKINIINNLLSLDTDKPLSAYQGKLLKDLVDNLFNLLTSDDTDLDELQEIVTYIKANKADLELLGTNKVNYSDIIDNLTTANPALPLSAKQGKVLNDDIVALDNKIVASMLLVDDYDNDTGEITLHTSYSTTYDSSSGEITFTI